MEPIKLWDRAAQKEDCELVYAEGVMRWLYETPIGSLVSESVICRPTFSKLYGQYQSTRWSAKKIPEFVRQYRIQMDEYEEASYSSFNDFFIRKFKPGVRKFSQVPTELPAFAEGRYFGFDHIGAAQEFPIKGVQISAAGILGDEKVAQPFIGGSILIARLCPTDYHRFHYPDEGRTIHSYRVTGKFHSVNPIALRCKGDVFLTNERQVSVLQTKNFGRLAYVEVGAMCVGRIVQTFPVSKSFVRGDEKGYFLFGGSTVILLGEPGAWKPDLDILEQTAQRRETFIKLGERVALASGSKAIGR